jgi:phage-related protein
VKPLVWLGDSLDRVRAFPADPRRQAGYQLERVQAGLEPADWKSMPSIGLGVKELRVRAGGAFRVVYLARFPEAVYVLHAFQKKSNKTARIDVEAARRRFGALLAERQV